MTDAELARLTSEMEAARDQAADMERQRDHLSHTLAATQQAFVAARARWLGLLQVVSRELDQREAAAPAPEPEAAPDGRRHVGVADLTAAEARRVVATLDGDDLDDAQAAEESRDTPRVSVLRALVMAEAGRLRVDCWDGFTLVCSFWLTRKQARTLRDALDACCPMTLLERLRAFARWPGGVAPWVRERLARIARMNATERAVSAAAERHGVPVWLALATADVEDGAKAPPSSPRTDGGSEDRGTWTYYPLGVKPDAAITVGAARTRDEGRRLVAELAGNADIGVRYLARGMRKPFYTGGHGLTGDEWVRAWYKAPSVTKRAWDAGRAVSFGDDPGDRWLTNWRIARRRRRTDAGGDGGGGLGLVAVVLGTLAALSG